MIICDESCKICRLWIIKGLQLVLLAGIASCKPSVKEQSTEKYRSKYALAIKHFSRPEDSLKLKAVYYILNNLEDQYFVDGEWLHQYQQAIFKSGDRSVKTLLQLLDSVKQVSDTRLDTIRDDKLLTDSLLIADIDNAFKVRKYKWAKDLNFNDFCEYVLPYKLGNEKPENWRQEATGEKYLANDSISQLSNEFQATNYVNKHLSWYHGTLNFEYPVDAGYQLTHAISTGTCYSISRMALFQMRQIGLPTVMDYVPTWGNRSEAHFWTALMVNGKPYPLDPTGPGIGSYKIEFKGKNRMPYKIAKVFRQTFSVQSGSLAALNVNDGNIPLSFKSKRIKDVTDDYVPTSDITLTFKNHLQIQFAYLYTFNDRSWTPCYWGIAKGNTVTFKNMGKDILYLPGIYLNNNEMIPLGNPFILASNGSVREILKQNIRVSEIDLHAKYPEDSSNEVEKNDLYELFFWDGQWRTLGKKIAHNNSLHFNNVPSDALFLLRDLTKGKQERIFTYENGRQVWW